MGERGRPRKPTYPVYFEKDIGLGISGISYKMLKYKATVPLLGKVVVLKSDSLINLKKEIREQSFKLARISLNNSMRTALYKPRYKQAK